MSAPTIGRICQRNHDDSNDARGPPMIVMFNNIMFVWIVRRFLGLLGPGETQYVSEAPDECVRSLEDFRNRIFQTNKQTNNQMTKQPSRQSSIQPDNQTSKKTTTRQPNNLPTNQPTSQPATNQQSTRASQSSPEQPKAFQSSPKHGKAYIVICFPALSQLGPEDSHPAGGKARYVSCFPFRRAGKHAFSRQALFADP